MWLQARRGGHSHRARGRRVSEDAAQGEAAAAGLHLAQLGGQAALVAQRALQLHRQLARARALLPGRLVLLGQAACAGFAQDIMLWSVLTWRVTRNRT